MAAGSYSAARTKAVAHVQAGIRQLSRGLRLLTREILKEVNGASRGRRHKPSPGRRLHGQYIGLIRNLSVRKKAMVRAVHAKKGVEAAIRMAREMRRSR
jgi:hypothetical protein